jgi:hypothetical protein
MITEILNLYREHFNYKNFYNILLTRILNNPDHYIDSKQLLSEYEFSKQISLPDNILTEVGDTRVDLPIWFGNPNSTNRIIILGMEPRDSDKSGRLNIERVGNNVFATPFALERKSGPYYSAFKEIIYQSDVFVYFTDIVKFYDVRVNKKSDDRNARKTFPVRARNQLSFLKEEISIIQPEKIISLGNLSYNFSNKYLIEHELLSSNSNILIKVRHPSNGGALIARDQIRAIFNQL